MKKIRDYSQHQIASQLSQQGLVLGVGPFVLRIHSRIDKISQGIYQLYADHPCFEDQAIQEAQFCDFHMHLVASGGLRRWYRPKMRFFFGGIEPFLPLPLHQALPLFEWAMNWCIANHSHQYLIIHAACLEKDGKGLIMPAPPGSGKSTLCAGLASRGWRLLSDELAIIDLTDGQLVGIARPISLKEKSIQVINDFAPASIISDPVQTDTKGIVAHVKPSTLSVEQVHQKVTPRWIVFPKWIQGASSSMQQRDKGKTFLEISENAFNYSLLGETGFKAMGQLLNSCSCFDFSYSNLEEAVSIFENLDDAPTQQGGEIKVITGSGGAS